MRSSNNVNSVLSKSYIGETGRCLSTRKKEHIRNVKMGKTGSNISVHAWRNNNSIDFNKTLDTPLALIK